MAQCAWTAPLPGGGYLNCLLETSHGGSHRTLAQEEMATLIRELQAVYDKRLAGGHRQWCAKRAAVGQLCTCGANLVAGVIRELIERAQLR